MRILILNWRCPRHPQAGGAEVLTHRIAERLVKWGHTVTWFAGTFDGAAPEETIAGVRVLRQGGQASVHWRAWRWYRQFGRRQFDLVVDEINTIPFFAPLYADGSVVAFIMQLAREVWWHEAPFYLSPLGYALEPLYLQAYRRTPVITISDSTAASLRALGLNTRAVIPMAVDFPAESVLPPLEEKEAVLTLVFVGRVVPSKRVDHMIRTLARLRELGTPAKLWIVGSADQTYKAALEAEIRKYQLGDAVRFWGSVDEEEKRRLLKRAHLLLACSVREGWGLTVTEANTVGTPAVVYDVPGLRDSTQHEVTGIVCQRNSPESLAAAVARLWRDRDLYQRLRQGAWAHSQTLNWDKTARAFWDCVRAIV